MPSSREPSNRSIPFEFGVFYEPLYILSSCSGAWCYVCVCVHFVSLLPIQSILLALSLLHHAIALIPPHAWIFGFWFSFKAYLYSLISTQIEWFGFFSVRVYLIYSLPCAQKRNWNVSHFLSTFAWVCSLLCAGPRTKRYTYIWFVHFDRRCIGHQHVMSLSEWKRPRASERERESRTKQSQCKVCRVIWSRSIYTRCYTQHTFSHHVFIFMFFLLPFAHITSLMAVFFRHFAIHEILFIYL